MQNVILLLLLMVPTLSSYAGNFTYSFDYDKVDSFSFFSYDDTSGVAGVAWIGTACLHRNNSYYKVNINEFLYNAAISGHIMAHELGHNMNMRHDFLNLLSSQPYQSEGRVCDVDQTTQCNGTGGVMDYSQANYTRWSCCSKSDFKHLWEANNPFCLDTSGNSIILLENFHIKYISDPDQFVWSGK
jgi:hypothetical protein